MTGEFAHAWVLEYYRSLAPIERAGIQFAATLVFASVLLGTLQGRGSQAVTKSRRSPIISTCIGFPSLLVVLALTSTGYFIVGSSLGTFFGVILVTVGLALLPTSAAVGIVAMGQAITARLGRDKRWLGVFTGSLVFGLAGLSVPVALAVAGITTMLGLGTVIRLLIGPGGATSPEERSVPPANKI
ncbi:hypothetical protein [Natrarchaeobius chitinivorans]|uniref:Uncharacterized protein n=1 Tax=Natrarchaeobius chitinivorans TaxID=1679083 RepID=A0A3N6MJJ4_NATCH|nr:hypothetical protein [Natrarchaeobius chitinivorans]RQG96001.1 hypothetical protein EA473_07435 [Natrarchaeobius chitinivorans]